MSSLFKRVFSRSLLLILGAIVLNIGLGQLAQYGLNLPLYLDSIGTVLVGALLGPRAGGQGCVPWDSSAVSS